MLNRMSQYLNDLDFRFTVYEDKIHIMNYQRIISLEENYISLQSNKKRIKIKGKDFILKKLLDNEMLIKGTITSIEVEND